VLHQAANEVEITHTRRTPVAKFSISALCEANDDCFFRTSTLAPDSQPSAVESWIKCWLFAHPLASSACRASRNKTARRGDEVLGRL
jgi:hypothetical protein